MFLAYPLITSFWYALNNIRITPLGKNFTFLGYGNFTQILLSDADFPTQLIDYLVSTIISVPVIVVFALIIAMMLNENIKAKGFFRLIFFLPVIIVSGPILGMLNQQGAGSITAIDTQAISSAITTFLPSAIGEPIAEIFENMVTILWYSGVQILIFLSGLQKIDRSMYEAAKIDGGSGWECFWKITLPTIKPMLLLNAIYTVVFLSQDAIISPLIDTIKAALQSVMGYGYAAAFAWMYAIVVLLFVGIVALCFLPKKDLYEKQIKKNKQLEKKTRKKLAKHQKQLIKNQIKLQKAIQKEEKMKLAGKDLGGGNYDG